jgi:hypothetical protein
MRPNTSAAVLFQERFPMGNFQNLSVLALRQLVNGACSTLGLSGGGDKVMDYLANRFTKHSQKLTTALQKANEQAWKTLEIALAGDSLWDRCKVVLASADDKAFREQVQAFLAESPLRKVKAEQRPILQQALKELRAARERGVLTEGSLAPAQLARQAGALASFNDPQTILDEEWRAVQGIAGELRETCPNRYRVLAAKINPNILVVAVRYYFRREVETDKELFQGMAWDKLNALEEALAGLTGVLARQGKQLDEVIKWVIDINIRLGRLEEQIEKVLKGIGGLNSTALRWAI